MSAAITQLTTLLALLRGVLWRHHMHRGPVYVLLFNRLGKAGQRVAALYARWQSGTLPALRPRTPGRKGGKPPALRPSRRRGWLAHEIWAVRFACEGLQHWCAMPEVTEFLAAVPRAARHLRPICHILGIAPPQLPALPPRKRAPRPPAPKAPATEPQAAKPHARPRRPTRAELKALLWYPNSEGKPMNLLPPRKKRLPR